MRGLFSFKKLVVIGIVLVVALGAVGSVTGTSFLTGSSSGSNDSGIQVISGQGAQSQAQSTPGADSSTQQAAPSASDTKVPATTATPATVAADNVQKASPLLLLNPASGAPGTTVGISGSGFDAGATVDLTLKKAANDKGTDLGFAQTDQSGGFGGVGFTIPDDAQVSSLIVVAQQENSQNQATATVLVRAGTPSVKFGTQVGKPGDSISISAKGFSPDEDVSVYFNSLDSQPIATLKADQGGSLGRASIKVPYGPSGSNSFILIGKTSQSPVTVNFLLLNFYPTAGISSYAAKADTTLTFNGTGFGPDEGVKVYLNSLTSQPIATAQTDSQGGFADSGGFVIPFSLTGKNTLIFVGQKSQSSTTASFDVLPYTPYAEVSTYGGRPGTTVTFYARDFARNEVVRVYVGATKDSPGKEVSCFMTDNQGSVGAGGSYVITADTPAGKLDFKMVGDKSKSSAVATMQVMAAGGPVETPPQADTNFVCPYDQQEAGSTSSQPSNNQQQPQDQIAQPADQQPQPTAQPAQDQPTQQPLQESTPVATPTKNGQ